MSITQDQAIVQVRARLDEPSSTYWTDQDLRIWINDVTRDLARRTESLRSTYNQPAVANTASYTPLWTSTNQPFRVYAVEYIPDGQTQTYPLEYRDRNAASEIWGLSQAQTVGVPAIWTSWGAPPDLTIQVYPTPGQAGNLRIWYYRLPTMLSTVDTIDMNVAIDMVDGWEDVLIDGVEYRALRRDGDKRWQEAKQEYEQHIDAMMQATLRFTDQAGSVITPAGGYIPGWLYNGADY